MSLEPQVAAVASFSTSSVPYTTAAVEGFSTEFICVVLGSEIYPLSPMKGILLTIKGKYSCRNRSLNVQPG